MRLHENMRFLQRVVGLVVSDEQTLYHRRFQFGQISRSSDLRKLECRLLPRRVQLWPEIVVGRESLQKPADLKSWGDCLNSVAGRSLSQSALPGLQSSVCRLITFSKYSMFLLKLSTFLLFLLFLSISANFFFCHAFRRVV